MPVPGRLPNTTERQALRGSAQTAVEELVATSYLRRQRRATFRDVRSALAWLITGDRSCENVHEARERGMDLRKGDDVLVEDLAFDPRSADYLVQEWADLDPASIAAPDVERAARADPRITTDPALFGDRDRELVQRRLFFGTWRPEGLGRRPCAPTGTSARSRRCCSDRAAKDRRASGTDSARAEPIARCPGIPRH